MIRLSIIGLILFLSCNIYGQIDINDSTAQIIGYFNQNEKQSYLVTTEKYEIIDSDTTDREFKKYKVDITIVDSTADTYIIDWYYYDYEVISANEIKNKLASLFKDATIRIRTDELGVFEEIINWKEIRESVLAQLKYIEAESKDIPNIEKVTKQIEEMFSTKESIKAGLVHEIQQFYAFHGERYEYAVNYVNESKVTNIYGGEPFDAKVTYWLDEINPDDNNVVMRMNFSIDSIQLSEEIYKYIVKMTENLQVRTPKKEELPKFTNETYTASRIHGSGWPIYSIQTKEIITVGKSSIEERIIEIL